MVFVPQTFTIKLIKKTKASSDAYSFYFKRPQGFDFLAGQYVKVTVDHKHPDERGTSRFFTIASSPTESYLMITTRIIQSSFKKTLIEQKIGSEVQMRGPHGAFVLDESDTSPRIFLAGGVGVTPFRSMIVYAENKNLSIPMTLLASFSTKDEFIFYDELNSLSGNLRKIIFTITKPGDYDWNGETGRIDEEKIKKHALDIYNSQFFIAGPAPYVEAMEKLVNSLGVSKENIKIENFPGY